MKEILVHCTPGEKRAVLVVDGKLDDFYIETERQNSILGNIYKGRVESILGSINGAFVDIGEGKNGFLYLTDVVNPLVEGDVSVPKKIFNKIFKRQGKQEGKSGEKPGPGKVQGPPPLKKGDEILVQVVKEPFGNKGARLTTHISLAGRFVVLMPFDDHLGVSKKIDESEERQRLRELLKDLDFVQNAGLIVRTVALQKGKREIIRDARFLYNIWLKIKKSDEQKKAPALIYKEYDLIWRIVRDLFTEDLDHLIIDSQEEFERLKKFLLMLAGPEMVGKIQLYKGSAPLFESKNVAGEINKIYDQKVYLKSGAYIVIEPTEGLIVVDVNSGRYKSHASPEDAAFQVNCDAAPEIARQLRLRDLGGIIVIDFIDMSKEQHKRRVLQILEAELSKDHAKSEVMKISPLGLVEMTRARTGKTIESISFESCPYCEGRGRVKID